MGGGGGAGGDAGLPGRVPDGGGGGTFGTFSGRMVEAEEGVTGVEELAGPEAGLIGPSGTWVFTGA